MLKCKEKHFDYQRTCWIFLLLYAYLLTAELLLKENWIFDGIFNLIYIYRTLLSKGEIVNELMKAFKFSCKIHTGNIWKVGFTNVRMKLIRPIHLYLIFEKSSWKNRTGFLVYFDWIFTACVPYKNQFWRLKIQFVEIDFSNLIFQTWFFKLDFSNLIFQKSSTYQQGDKLL